MTVLDDVALLGEITAFAAEVFAKPTGTDSAERREHLAFLAQKLDETAASTAYRHIVCRFAPSLIKATEGALHARAAGDARMATKWDKLIGALVPDVREDAQALLARAKEA